MERKQPPPENSSRSDVIRRRRRNRSFFSTDNGAQETILEEMGQKLIPRFDFLLFSLLSGLAIGIAVFTDSLPILVLALALTPFLAPVLGLAFGLITGSTRYFARVLAGFLMGSLLAFAGSFLIGWISKTWSPANFDLAREMSVFSWISLAVLLAGVVPTTIFAVRAEMTRAATVGLILIFFTYLPLGISAFGLARGIPGLWPQGLYLFLLYLAWAVITGVFTFAAFNIRPKQPSGYLLGAVFLLAGSAGLILFNMEPAEATVPPQTEVTSAAAVEIQRTAALEAANMANTITPTRAAPSAISTKTRTPIPSLTPTKTTTPQPTSVFALINAEGNGAIVRLEPDLNAPSAMPALMDGTEVKVLPETFEKGKIFWIRIRTIEGKEGWIMQELLATLTPVPE